MNKFYRFCYERFQWSKEQVEQNLLNAGILVSVLLLASLFALALPAVRSLAITGFALGSKLVVYVLGGVLLVFGPGFFSNLVVRWFIDLLDQKHAFDIDIPSWIHWFVAIVGGVFFGWLWTYAIDFIVSIPGHLNALFVSWHWFVDGVVQGQFWWGLVGAITFFIGYFWKGIRKEMYF